jgi:hypothetical protein
LDVLLTENQSGLAWHTEEATLRQKFEEFGAVEEAVSCSFVHHITPWGTTRLVCLFDLIRLPGVSTRSSNGMDSSRQRKAPICFVATHVWNCLSNPDSSRLL